MNPIVGRGKILKWKFENVKDLTDKQLHSDKFTFEGIDWKIIILTCTEETVKYLAVFLYYECSNEDDKNWICETSSTMKLMNQTENGKHRFGEADRCYDAEDNGWGLRKFISWVDLEKDGYMKDDSIIIEIDLSFKYYDFSKNIPNYTDITLVVGDTQFFVNKGMLCSKSKYFNDLFVGEMSEKTTITLEDVKVEDFRYFMASLYPLFKTVKMENYKQLMELAAKYGVPSLHENCENFLISNTEIELIDKLKYADQHDYYELLKVYIASLKSAQQIKMLLDSVEFHNLKKDTQSRIMTRILDFF